MIVSDPKKEGEENSFHSVAMTAIAEQREIQKKKKWWKFRYFQPAQQDKEEGGKKKKKKEKKKCQNIEINSTT